MKIDKTNGEFIKTKNGQQKRPSFEKLRNTRERNV